MLTGESAATMMLRLEITCEDDPYQVFIRESC
jgi:hypothetical protein